MVSSDNELNTAYMNGASVHCSMSTKVIYCGILIFKDQILEVFINT